MNRSLAGWIFAGPALVVIGVFFGLPVLAALALSLTDFDLYALADRSNLRFVGLDNYWSCCARRCSGRRWATRPTSWRSACRCRLPCRWARRCCSTHRWPGSRPCSTALFAPVVTTLVAVAVIWRYLFHTSYGLVNWALGHVGIAPVDWLGDPRWAMPTIILFAVWKNFGYNMVILLAGLQGIPQDLYEAARIDGASRWKQFLYITLPQLGPVLLVVGVITVSGYFQLFAEPYVMTRGDPLQSTVSVLYFMFEEGFKWWNLGRASAVAFLLFLIILGVTTLMLRLGRRKELV